MTTTTYVTRYEHHNITKPINNGILFFPVNALVTNQIECMPHNNGHQNDTWVDLNTS